MIQIVMRCRLLDRPGALGQIGSRIGAVHADIKSVAVFRLGPNEVVDEFLIEFPDETPVGQMIDLLRSEVGEVEDVTVESCEIAVSGPAASGVVWFEILVDDVGAAATFYDGALGWRCECLSPGRDAYSLIHTQVGAPPIGALVFNPDSQRTAEPSGTIVYVYVDSVESAVESFVDAGGEMRREDDDAVDGIMQFAVLADPWGNRIGLWSGSQAS